MRASLSIGDFLDDASARGLNADTSNARGLPGKAYGADFYILEQRELFPKMWCVAAVVSDLRSAGDMLPVEIAGWPVLILRDQSEELRAFHNICRHRAMRLVTEPCRQSEIVCPWHAWRYSLHGECLRTPRIGGQRSHTQPGLEAQRLGLVPVALACWNDLVFVNLDAKAAAFDTHIKPLNDLLARYDLSSLKRADSWEIEYPGNWKVAVEGAIEDYHLPVGHPQLVNAALEMNPELDFVTACFFSNSMHREYARTEDANPASGAQLDLPLVPFDGPEDKRRTFFMNVFPTGMFQMHQHNAVQGLFLPAGPDRTRLLFNHYYVGDAASDPRYEEQRNLVTEEWQKVFEQDIPFVHYVHQNYLIRDAVGIDTRFSAVWESNVHEFQKTMVEVIRQ